MPAIQWIPRKRSPSPFSSLGLEQPRPQAISGVNSSTNRPPVHPRENCPEAIQFLILWHFSNPLPTRPELPDGHSQV